MIGLQYVVRVIVLLGFVALPACVQFGGPKPVQSLAMFDGEVTVNAPIGYCVVMEASEPSKGFAVLAGCGSVIADVSRKNPAGIATIQIGDVGSAIVDDEEDDLVAFLSSDGGAKLMGATPDEVWGKDGMVGVHFADGGEFRVNGIQDSEWRVFVDKGERLVTIRLRGSYLNPVSADRGYSILSSMAQGISG